LKDYTYREARFTMLVRSNPDLAAKLLEEAQDDVQRQWHVYSARATMTGSGDTAEKSAAVATGDGK
jgi:pyruvate-ferredoxin/flavodoxin oxidoreductase